MMDFDRNYYRSQAQKRLRLVYEYAHSDLESGQFVDVYHLCAGIAGVEVNRMFTQAESNMWHDIRAFGRYMRFYPEYPIGDDQVDFTDPHKKIVIEVDSNLHDPAKDTAKDKRLRAAGYRIIRVHKKHTTKDLEQLRNIIDTARVTGRAEAAASLEENLPLNSESIIKALRREYTPKEQPSKEDLHKVVLLSDFANTPEFKRHYRKYYTARPAQLETAIAAIPLTRDSSALDIAIPL